MKTRKLLGIVLALVLMIGALAAISVANAQMCTFSIYVNGQKYSDSASYAVSGQLKYNASTRTVTLNGFNGQSIEAVPGGFYGDEDAPSITINVAGDSYLTGGKFYDDSRFFGALYARPREGGSGADSRITVTSSNGKKLTISKWENTATRATATNYAAIMADQVIFSGDVNVDITTKLYGLGDSSHSYTVNGIVGNSLVSFANTGINNINISAATGIYVPGGGTIIEYPSYATLNGVYVPGGNFRSQQPSGYTSVNVAESVLSKSTPIAINVKNFYVADFRTALYADGGAKGIAVNASSTSVTNKSFILNNSSVHYAAYIPEYSNTNSALKPINVTNVVSLTKLYAPGESKPADETVKSDTQAYIVKMVEKTSTLSSNTVVDFTKFENNCNYRYRFMIYPKPGVYVSSTSVTNIDTALAKEAYNLRVEPDMAQYVYAANAAAYIFRYGYSVPVVTKQPTAVTASARDAVSFSIAATGNNITYKWYRIDTNGIRKLVSSTDGSVTGQNTASFTFDPKKAGDNYGSCGLSGNKFFCVVTNKYGSVESDKALLTVEHQKTLVAAEPDETNKDYHYYVCYCGEKILEDHDLDIVDEKAATCTSTGSRTVECFACGYSETQTTAKAAHTKVTDKAVKATMTKDGKTAGSHCSVCKAVITKQKTIYKASKVTLSKTSFVYSGKAQRPTVTVKDSKGNTLKKDKDYTVKYSNSKSKAAGTYTVTVTFKGNYSGTKKLTYKIAPKAVTGVKVTSPAKKSAKVTFSKATGATGYEIQYSTKKTSGFKKLATTKNTSYTYSKLTSSKTYYFKVRAYTKASDGTIIYGAWSKVYSCKIK